MDLRSSPIKKSCPLVTCYRRELEELLMQMILGLIVKMNLVFSMTCPAADNRPLQGLVLLDFQKL